MVITRPNHSRRPPGNPDEDTISTLSILNPQNSMQIYVIERPAGRHVNHVQSGRIKMREKIPLHRFKETTLICRSISAVPVAVHLRHRRRTPQRPSAAGSYLAARGWTDFGGDAHRCFAPSQINPEFQPPSP
jgi:hypothetical protein